MHLRRESKGGAMPSQQARPRAGVARFPSVVCRPRIGNMGDRFSIVAPKSYAPRPLGAGERGLYLMKGRYTSHFFNSMSSLNSITFVLLIVGGLNWLLFALTGMDVGSILGGMDSMIAKVIYILVGLSAIYQLVTHKWSSAPSAM